MVEYIISASIRHVHYRDYVEVKKGMFFVFFRADVIILLFCFGLLNAHYLILYLIGQ